MGEAWIVVLRWIIIGALAVAVVGVPVVYHQREVAKAHTAGVAEGRAACVADYAKQAIAAKNESDALLQKEQERAEAAQAAEKTATRDAARTRKKLNDFLNEKPTPQGCPGLSEPIVDILRGATRGSFDRTPKGEALPSPTAPELRNRT